MLPRVVLRRAFVLASVAWAVVLPLAPLAVTRPPSGRLYAFAFLVYGLGSTVCHQLPGRSFFLHGAQWPVCARCAGIYAGGALGAIAWVARVRRMAFTWSAAGRAAGAETLALVAAWTPAAITLLYEWTTGITPSNLARALSGLPAGFVVGWIVVTATASRPAMR